MTKRLTGAKSIVFVNFKALPVSETKILRRQLLADKIGYFVTKKTLAKRVLGDLKAKGDMPELPGELAIAYGEDLLAPARETYAFQKTAREKGSISIVGGIFDGEFKTQAEMMSIATIPPRQVLLAQFVNLINSPIQRFAVVVSEISKSKESGTPTPAKAEVKVEEVVPVVAEIIAPEVEVPVEASSEVVEEVVPETEAPAPAGEATPEATV